MQTLWQDLRYGARMLIKQPGFTLIAVITLALGIGANTAIFSVINGVVLRPLPYPEPARLVRVWEDPGANPRNFVNPRNFADWRDMNQVFETAAAFSTGSVNLTGDGEPERLITVRASASFFSILRVDAAIGRTFLADEDRSGSERVAVLSHGLWQRRFGADPAVIGRAITLDGESATVVGVMPADFRFPQRADLWMPLVFTPQQMDNNSRGSHYLATVARLKPGVAVGQAQAEITAIYDRLREQYPEALTNWKAHVVPMHEDMVGDVKPSLYILLGAVGFVLLIACANVANLMLARATTRQREMAIRAALGAGRLRLLRQLLTESLLLALIGGGLGVLLGLWGIDLLLSLEPTNVPRLDQIGMDGRVLAFSLLLSLASGVIFGIAPALSVSKNNLSEALKDAGARVIGGRQQHLRRTFVVAEVALSLVLLIGSGLMIRSFMQLQRVEMGFNPENVLTMRVALPRRSYGERPQRIAFYQQVTQRVADLPGVRSAALISDPPISGSVGLWQNRFDVEGWPIPPPGERYFAYLRWISPDYFQTMGVPLLRGRALTPSDVDGKPWVAVIDEAMARKFFPGEDPIGKRLIIYAGAAEQAPREIVGVVGNVRQTRLDLEAEPHMYVPYFQTPLDYATLLVRAAADPANLAGAVKSEVLAVDPNQPVYSIRSMEQIITESVAPWRFNMLLLGIFAGVALVLAAVGIYGVMAYFVTQRTREIGIRMALGARQGDVLRLVVGRGVWLAAIGIAAGLAAAVGLTRLLDSLLYGVSATDPATFALVALVLLGVALVACYLPARRATKVDPMAALRSE